MSYYDDSMKQLNIILNTHKENIVKNKFPEELKKFL